MAISRTEILKRLRANVKAGIPIVGTGAGTGLSAKCEERGGSDLIIVYNTGEHRMQGRPSCSGLLPLGDANDTVVRLASYVLPVVKDTPVIAGVFAIDPYRDMRVFLRQIKDLGFSGVQNFPTVGSYDGRMRREFENVGYSYDKEVEMVRIARELDLLTTPYAFTNDEAERMVKAGCDVLVAHCGCTIGGYCGVSDDVAMNLDDAVEFCQGIHDAAVAINPDVLVICHGGPLAGPKDAEYVMRHTKGIVGFYGASSSERLPTEVAITNTIREFKSFSYRD